MSIEHQVKLNTSTITIKEPTASQASVLLMASRGAQDLGTFDNATKATDWIIATCVNPDEYKKLDRLDQLKTIEALVLMSTGSFVPKS